MPSNKSLWFFADGEYHEAGKGHVIKDEGIALSQRKYLDFVGDDVTVTDDSVNDKSIVTVGSVAAPVTPLPDVIATLAATNGLRGYWRLGDGGFGPYADTSGHVIGGFGVIPVPMARTDNTIDMTDLSTGALPAGDDDGAIQFNSSVGSGSDYLVAPNVWGTITNNPFDADIGTIAAWIKPSASTSTFNGGIFSMVATVTSPPDQGYSLGVSWPSRTIFHLRGSTMLTGPALAADEWVFVCGVKDATSTRIYVNGVLVAYGPPVTGTPGTNVNPKIGQWHQSSLQVFYGAIDEVSVWGAALSDSDIALLAASGGLITPSLLSIIFVSTNFTASASHDVLLASGTITITLPTAVGNSGKKILIKNVGTGTITVARTSSQTIDGAASNITISTTKQAREFLSDGTGWQITGAAL